MKRILVSICTAAVMILICVICVAGMAQQEVAPDHYDGTDYRVPPNMKRQGSRVTAHRSSKSRLRRPLALVPRNHRIGRNRQVTEVR